MSVKAAMRPQSASTTGACERGMPVAKFGELPAQRIDQHGALTHEQVARSVQHQD